MTGSHASAKLDLLLLGEASEQASLPLPPKSCEVFWIVSKHLPTFVNKTHNSIMPINTSVDSWCAGMCPCSTIPFLPIESFPMTSGVTLSKKSAEDAHLTCAHTCSNAVRNTIRVHAIVHSPTNCMHTEMSCQAMPYPVLLVRRLLSCENLSLSTALLCASACAGIWFCIIKSSLGTALAFGIAVAPETGYNSFHPAPSTAVLQASN